MRIVCPSCSAAYDVPDSLVTAGRVVRCARCGGDWSPVPVASVRDAGLRPPPTDEPPAAAALRVPATEAVVTQRPPRLSAMERLASHPAGRQSRLRLRLAWAASFVVLALAVWGACAWRTQIVVSWPPSARMYAAFGLHPGTGPAP